MLAPFCLLVGERICYVANMETQHKIPAEVQQTMRQLAKDMPPVMDAIAAFCQNLDVTDRIKAHACIQLAAKLAVASGMTSDDFNMLCRAAYGTSKTITEALENHERVCAKMREVAT